MKLDIHESDVSSSLCQSCAACCRVHVTVPATDSRFRSYLRAVGVTVLPPVPNAGDKDCCDQVHDIRIDLGACPHLVVPDEGAPQRYSCALHGADDYPELCRDYNCVSWAKSSNKYTESNELIAHAQRTLDVLRARQEHTSNAQ